MLFPSQETEEVKHFIEQKIKMKKGGWRPQFRMPAARLRSLGRPVDHGAAGPPAVSWSVRIPTAQGIGRGWERGVVGRTIQDGQLWREMAGEGEVAEGNAVDVREYGELKYVPSCNLRHLRPSAVVTVGLGGGSVVLVGKRMWW